MYLAPVLATLSILSLLAVVLNGLFWSLATRKLVQRLAPKPRNTPAVLPPAVSVLVAARNEGKNLEAHLPLLLTQQYSSPYEVLVGDDASTDDTPNRLTALAAAHPTLSSVRLRDKVNPGKKQVLAKAIGAASHDWLLLTDADCAPASRHWIQHLSACLTPSTQIVLGYGPQRHHPGWLNRWIRFETFYTAVQYLSAALWGRPYMGVGRNLMYTRAIYEAAGGFQKHAHLSGGDDDLLINASATATNTAICLHPASWTYSEPKRSWAAYRRQKRRHLSVSTSYKRFDQVWLGLLALSHVGQYVGLLSLIVMDEWPLALLLYVGRLAVVWPRVRNLAQGLGEASLVRFWPLLDVLLCGYYLLSAFAVTPRPQKATEW